MMMSSPPPPTSTPPPQSPSTSRRCSDAETTPTNTSDGRAATQSRIPKPSPLPARRALSARMRSDSVDALPQHSSGYDTEFGAHRKPYNCCFDETDESNNCSAALHKNDDNVDDYTDELMSRSTAPSSLSLQAKPSAAVAPSTSSSQHRQHRASLPNSVSLSCIGNNGSNVVASMAQPHSNGVANGGPMPQYKRELNGGGAGSKCVNKPHPMKQHSMSLDLSHTNNAPAHHHLTASSLATTPTSAFRSKSTNPSPLTRRRSTSAHRALSYPNGSIQSPHSLRSPPGGAANGGGLPPLPLHGRSCTQRHSPKTPPVSPDDPLTGYPVDDDAESVYSYTSMASGRSTMSCDHPFVAHNGTTFSGRKMKYVVHCSSHAGQTGDDYLTPTQRAQKHIRRLKMLLSQAHMDLEQRDSEILRLTKEVVELRLFKASLTSPDDRSQSSDAVTVREAGDPATSTDVSPIVVDAATITVAAATPQDGERRNSAQSHSIDDIDAPLMSKSVSPRHYAPTALFLDKVTSSSSHSEMQSSFADSGHFEDITCTSSVHSRDSYVQTSAQQQQHLTAAGGPSAGPSSSHHHAHHRHSASGTGATTSCTGSTANLLAAEEAAFERSELIRFYELKIEDLIKNHSDESQEVRVTHNDRVEALLQRLAECNARYSDMVPDHEQAKERIRELERQLEELQQRLQDQENKANKMYLHMFSKGQEAERIQQADKVMEMASTSMAAAGASGSGGAAGGAAAVGARVSVPELMQQLQVTQNELENIKDTNYVQERGNAQVLLSAKEAISLWLLGARKTMYRRLIDAQQSKNKVDPEVTLQFLKSAVYYFLTDKENNTRGHLNAIESILGYSDVERRRIEQSQKGQSK